jgi:Domain of unknown function (DUF4365)
MYPTAQKEQYSLAYLHAVATVAGFTLLSPFVDDDSVDVTLQARGLIGQVRSPQVQLQLKCTKNLNGNATHWTFQLERKNYEELRPDDFQVPRILVILHVPPQPRDWLVPGDDHMRFHRRAYWTSLRGKAPLPEGQQSAMVHIPRANVFDVAGLTQIAARIGQGAL